MNSTYLTDINTEAPPLASPSSSPWCGRRSSWRSSVSCPTPPSISSHGLWNVEIVSHWHSIHRTITNLTIFSIARSSTASALTTLICFFLNFTRKYPASPRIDLLRFNDFFRFTFDVELLEMVLLPLDWDAPILLFSRGMKQRTINSVGGCSGAGGQK